MITLLMVTPLWHTQLSVCAQCNVRVCLH